MSNMDNIYSQQHTISSDHQMIKENESLPFIYKKQKNEDIDIELGESAGVHSDEKQTSEHTWPVLQGLPDLLLLVNVILWITTTIIRFKRDYVPLGLLISLSVSSLIVLIFKYKYLSIAFRDALWRSLCGFAGGRRFADKRLQYRANIWWYSPLVKWIWGISVGVLCWGTLVPKGYPWFFIGTGMFLGYFGDNNVLAWVTAFQPKTIRNSKQYPSRLLDPTAIGTIFKRGFTGVFKMRTSKVCLVFFESSVRLNHCSVCSDDQHWCYQRDLDRPLWCKVSKLSETIDIKGIEGYFCACEWNAIGKLVKEMGSNAWVPVATPRNKNDANLIRVWSKWRTSPWLSTTTANTIIVGGVKNPLNDNQNNNSMWIDSQTMALFDYSLFIEKFSCLWRDTNIEQQQLQKHEWNYEIIHSKGGKESNKSCCSILQGYSVMACKDKATSSRLSLVQRVCKMQGFGISEYIANQVCSLSALNSDLSYLLVAPGWHGGLKNGLELFLNENIPPMINIHQRLWEFNPDGSVWGDDGLVSKDNSYSYFVLDRKVKELPYNSISIFNSNVELIPDNLKWFTTSILYTVNGKATSIYLGLIRSGANNNSKQKQYKLYSISIGDALNLLSVIPIAKEVIII